MKEEETEDKRWVKYDSPVSQDTCKDNRIQGVAGEQTKQLIRILPSKHIHS